MGGSERLPYDIAKIEYALNQIESITKHKIITKSNDITHINIQKLTNDEIIEINKIFKKQGIFDNWNEETFIVVAFAGIAASLIDIFVVDSPQGKVSKFIKSKTQKIHDKYFKKIEIKYKVPYDSTPKGGDHRMYSLGHDPLLGFIFGIHDILTGKSTYIKNGEIISDKIGELNKETNIWKAFVKHYGHLISDVFTKRGLPVPGWALTQTLNFGKIGKKERTIAQIAKYMYLKGYDLRHYTLSAVTPATVELTIRGYCYLENESLNNLELSERKNKIDDRKKLLMLYMGHSISTASNAGRVCLTRNPLNINITQWQIFFLYSLKMSNLYFKNEGIITDKITHADNMNKYINSIKQELKNTYITIN